MSELIALQRWIPDIAEREVFLCGPKHVDGRHGMSAPRGRASK
jgi:hypothetical protein